MRTNRLLGTACVASFVFVVSCVPLGGANRSTGSPGDLDGDGISSGLDCDDGDSKVGPGVVDEVGDAIDQNCDGVDGVLTSAVFVNAATGRDSSSCGRVSEPCSSIDAGQARAQEMGREEVRIAGGEYERFQVVADLELRGGYGQNWQHGRGATGDAVSVVRSSFDVELGGSVAILADDVSSPTVVAELTVTGGVAPRGAAHYGVVVRGSSSALVLRSIQIHTGTGGDGADGNDGDSIGGIAAAGGDGGDGFEPGRGCNDRDAGDGGSGVDGGGDGGDGGAISSDCGFFSFGTGHAAADGERGSSSSSAEGGTGGRADSGGDGCDGNGLPTDGADGDAGRDGAAGSDGRGGAAFSGAVSDGRWVVNGGLGTSGAGGERGHPGGGGGGGGASDCNYDDAGAGGGGGGAGGAGSATGGAGGGPGAASIGLFLHASFPTLHNVQITLGVGGAGGDGGDRGLGQPGGPGGRGGDGFGDGGAGGRGGIGGHGGSSGAGGGGAGGPAIGMALSAGSTPDGIPTMTGGVGGRGGNGSGSVGDVLAVAELAPAAAH